MRMGRGEKANSWKLEEHLTINTLRYSFCTRIEFRRSRGLGDYDIKNPTLRMLASSHTTGGAINFSRYRGLRVRHLSYGVRPRIAVIYKPFLDFSKRSDQETGLDRGIQKRTRHFFKCPKFNRECYIVFAIENGKNQSIDGKFPGSRGQALSLDQIF